VIRDRKISLHEIDERIDELLCVHAMQDARAVGIHHSTLAAFCWQSVAIIEFIRFAFSQTLSRREHQSQRARHHARTSMAGSAPL
jgi:hypothetical protein